MTPSRPRHPPVLSLLVAVAGAALLGHGLHDVMRVIDCPLGQVCGEPSDFAILSVPGGMVLGVIGISLGAGGLGFVALFLGVGIGALVAGLQGGSIAVFGVLFGGGFTAVGLLLLIGPRLATALGLGKGALLADLRKTGVAGVATVDWVRDTGVTVNNDPRVELRVTIRPKDGSALVQRAKTTVVSRVAVPRQGEHYPAWFDRADESRWVMGSGLKYPSLAPADVRALFEDALLADMATRDQRI